MRHKLCLTQKPNVYDKKQTINLLITPFAIRLIYTPVRVPVAYFPPQLWVDGSQISYTNQYWNNAQGGGTRSGVIFPIVGKYVNTLTSQKQINIRVQNNTDVDTITIYKDSSCWLKITEIGR